MAESRFQMVIQPSIELPGAPQDKTFVLKYFNKGELDFDEQGLDENVKKRVTAVLLLQYKDSIQTWLLNSRHQPFGRKTVRNEHINPLTTQRTQDCILFSPTARDSDRSICPANLF